MAVHVDSTNIGKYLDNLLNGVESDKYLLTMPKGLKFRFENNGRITTFICFYIGDKEIHFVTILKEMLNDQKSRK
ncbi:hypothetical protein [Thermococcus sp. 2319x1]|uniref:hypothetical protein n=1 Tax=Thermococcus sp. 2319x1 TaxID=1674923 RepID=UPI00073D41DB|nr:hypothetical protein [Thermococcus sp. 2319x1]